jgi:pimeloyl-ACP methyl ester carboxylesterase
MRTSPARRFRIDSPRPGHRLCLHRLQSRSARADRPIVLYLHGATFPSALSVAYRFDGCSWCDALDDAGFDVWALDFLGFGESDRYVEMDEPPEHAAPLGLAAEAARQVDAAVRFITTYTGQPTLSFITHRWGSMPAGLFAALHPTRVDRIVMFAPIARRTGARYTPTPDGPAWRIVTADQQWARFVEDLPPHEPPVLPREVFDAWVRTYSPPISRRRAVFEHRPARSSKSCARGMASWPGIQDACRRRSPSCGGPGMAS